MFDRDFCRLLGKQFACRSVLMQIHNLRFWSICKGGNSREDCLIGWGGAKHMYLNEVLLQPDYHAGGLVAKKTS